MSPGTSVSPSIGKSPHVHLPQCSPAPGAGQPAAAAGSPGGSGRGGWAAGGPPACIRRCSPRYACLPVPRSLPESREERTMPGSALTSRRAQGRKGADWLTAGCLALRSRASDVSEWGGFVGGERPGRPCEGLPHAPGAFQRAARVRGVEITLASAPGPCRPGRFLPLGVPEKGRALLLRQVSARRRQSAGRAALALPGCNSRLRMGLEQDGRKRKEGPDRALCWCTGYL